MENINLRNPTYILRCLGELAVWALQDALTTVDENIAELPDYV